jgi:hypothetical protein
VHNFHQQCSSYYMPLRRYADVHSLVCLTASGVCYSATFLWGLGRGVVWNVILYVEGWQIDCWRDQGGRF